MIYDDPAEAVVELRGDGTWSYVRKLPTMKIFMVSVVNGLPVTDGSGKDIYGRSIISPVA